jgi:hypothetical protein
LEYHFVLLLLGLCLIPSEILFLCSCIKQRLKLANGTTREWQGFLVFSLVPCAFVVLHETVASDGPMSWCSTLPAVFHTPLAYSPDVWINWGPRLRMIPLRSGAEEFQQRTVSIGLIRLGVLISRVLEKGS